MSKKEEKKEEKPRPITISGMTNASGFQCLACKRGELVREGIMVKVQGEDQQPLFMVLCDAHGTIDLTERLLRKFREKVRDGKIRGSLRK